MGRRLMAVAVGVVLVLALGRAARAEGPLPIGAVTAVTGTVQLGRDGVWQVAAPKMPVFAGQLITTGDGASVEVLFEGGLPATVAGKGEIAVADLLLKAQLEKARAKIAVPADATKTEMQVTPLTGVRGTEQAEEKAGDLKRDHYWNESTPAEK